MITYEEALKDKYVYFVRNGPSTIKDIPDHSYVLIEQQAAPYSGSSMFRVKNGDGYYKERASIHDELFISKLHYTHRDTETPKIELIKINEYV